MLPNDIIIMLVNFITMYMFIILYTCGHNDDVPGRNMYWWYRYDANDNTDEDIFLSIAISLKSKTEK